jgi:hypothetical protein
MSCFALVAGGGGTQHVLSVGDGILELCPQFAVVLLQT